MKIDEIDLLRLQNKLLKFQKAEKTAQELWADFDGERVRVKNKYFTPGEDGNIDLDSGVITKQLPPVASSETPEQEAHSKE